MDADFLLIHKMKNGDEEAIEVFVKILFNYTELLSITYTDCDAEDITQATFEHFFDHLDRIIIWERLLIICM